MGQVARRGVGRPPMNEATITRTIGASKGRSCLLKMPMGCRIVVWIPMIVMFTLIAVLIALVIYIRRT